jgi:hypothetical protein
MIFGKTYDERRANYWKRRNVTGRFAWVPVVLADGRWFWLGRYTWSTTYSYGGSETFRYPIAAD